MTNNQLKAFVERIERLEEEKSAIADDIKEVYAEAKGTGFDVKIMRKIVAMRKKDASELREEQEMIALYMNDLGMVETSFKSMVATHLVRSLADAEDAQ